MVDWEPRDGVWFQMMLDRANELAAKGLTGRQVAARTGLPAKVAEGCVCSTRRRLAARKGVAA